MKINLVCVGKLKEDYFVLAANEYKKRLSRFCNIEIVELADSADSADSAKREGEEILKKLKGFVITLQIEGKNLSSEQLAQRLDNIMLSASEISVVIGGSRGLSDEVKRRSDFALSFGNMTFPHQLMRVIALEQLYRAFSILQNLPYHK